MTHVGARGKRGPLIAAMVILLLAWVVAGLLNFDSAWMGGDPPAVGVVATLLAVCAWPVVGWLAGSRPGTGLIRFAAVFWITEAVGVWALDTAGAYGWAVLLFLPLGVPLYGLLGVLPSWGQPVAPMAVIGVAAFAMTLAAYLVRRRIGGHPAYADVS